MILTSVRQLGNGFHLKNRRTLKVPRYHTTCGGKEHGHDWEKKTIQSVYCVYFYSALCQSGFGSEFISWVSVGGSSLIKLVKCRPSAFIVFGVGSRAVICFRESGISELVTSRRKRIFYLLRGGDPRKHRQWGWERFWFPIVLRQMELEANKPLNGGEEERAQEGKRKLLTQNFEYFLELVSKKRPWDLE